jgi:hypothetical protein
VILYDDDVIPLLSAATQSFVVDPFFADTVEASYDTVTVGQPTAGPNRYTIHVPKETTRLSLGAPSGRWNTDIGITGYTDSHIHFETKKEAKTIVSLGGPATTSAVKGYGDAAPVSTHGYSMVTLERAWQEAMKQHYLLSLTGDITLRTKGEGKRAVVQAKAGFVDVNGFLEVNVAARAAAGGGGEGGGGEPHEAPHEAPHEGGGEGGGEGRGEGGGEGAEAAEEGAGGGISIGAHNGMPFKDAEYGTKWGGETPHSLMAKRSATASNIAAAATTAHNLVMGAAKMRHEYKHGHLHPSVDTFADVAEWLADLGEFINLAGEVKEGFAKEEPPEESINVDAEMDFGGAAGGEAAFFGVKSAGIASTIWGGVSAVVAASMQGTVFSGVAGTYTSCKGYKKVEVSCDHGDAHFDAKRDVSISAEKSLIAVGEELAQVASKEKAYFAGGKKVWIGTAAGGGWGMSMSSAGIKLGKATSADQMTSAAVEADRSIEIHAKGFALTSSSSKLTQDDGGVAAKATQVKFHAKDSDVRVGGKKILIDGP